MILTIIAFIITISCFGSLGYYITELLSFTPYNSDEKLINSLISALFGSFIFVILFYLFGGLT